MVRMSRTWDPMSRTAFYTTIVASAAALVASASLLVDYIRPAPVFCGDGGGCGLVKKTALAYPVFHIPMPVFGIVGILAIALLAAMPGRRARIAQAMAGVFGGIVAAGLLVVQAAMGTICPFCAVVDTAALVLAVLSVARALKEWDPPASRVPVIAGVGVAVSAVALPLAIGFAKKPPVPAIGVPDIVRAEMAKTPEGKITVIDFADYECPFCRRTHEHLAPMLEQYKDRVRVVHKNVPLRMHPHAADAARAACCADKLGKGTEMSEALFRADPSQLTKDGCEKLATEHGLDITKFRACFGDPATEASIQADTQALRDSEPDHKLRLPTIWVGTHKLQGEQDDESLREAFDSASRAL
jgi:protein-disulfide isomerase